MPDLFDQKNAVEATVIEPMEETQETGLSVPGDRPEPSYSGGSQALTDLRQGAMTLPVAQMAVALDEYKERRAFFFNWLLRQLVQGVHYGYPPGCEVRFDPNGNAIQKKWNNKTRGYDEVIIPLDQWKQKPCLYKAGADFICDLMGLRPEWETDHDTHKQLALVPLLDRDKNPQPVVCYVCRLFSRFQPSLVMGEGRGGRMLGTKGGDVNNTIKMAQKAAKVDAVINCYGLSDLFTQDIEDTPQREPYEAPDAREESPPAQPRGKRVTIEDVNALVSRYKARKPTASLEDWGMFVQSATGKAFKNVKAVAEWCQRDIDHVSDKIEMELET